MRTYTHLLPSSETRTRKAIDDAFTETEAEAEDEGDPPADQGTSVPQAKPMCPQCALAARRPSDDMKQARPEDPARIQRNPQLTARQGNKADAPPHAADG